MSDSTNPDEGRSEARRSARAHRRHRPPDPGADRRARELRAPGRQGQGQAHRGGRLLPARTRGAGAAHGRRSQRRPAQRRSAGARVPRNHVGVPGAAGAAEDRLSRPGRHVQPAGGAQAFRPFRARPAAGQHRGSVPGSRSRQRRFRRGAGRELGAGHDPDHARHVPDLEPQDLRRSRAARAPVPVVAQRAHRGHRAHLFASAVVRADARRGCAATCRRSRRSRCRAMPKRARRARNADDAAAIAGESAGHRLRPQEGHHGLDRGSRRQHDALPRARPRRFSRRRATTAPRCWCSSRTSRARCSTCSARSRATASA